MDNGDSVVSRIKQVASGRFGVTAEYLVNATDFKLKWPREQNQAKAGNCRVIKLMTGSEGSVTLRQG